MKIVKKLKLDTTWPLHLMLLPVIVLLIIFCYIPMVGLVISFQDYIPTKGFFGSPWIGLDNYKFLFSLNDFTQIMKNTVGISILKIVFGTIVPLFFAIAISESRISKLKNSVQVIVFLPFFLSWVILGGLFVDIFSIGGGVNQLLGMLGIKPLYFMGNPFLFIVVLVVTEVWKGFGYNSIIFYSSILGIAPELYESATIDGAGRLQKIFHIKLPGIMPIIVVMSMLSLTGILNAGFDQIFNMYNQLVIRYADILDTYIYRMGIVGGQYGLATAVGLFKSIIGMFLLLIGNKLSKEIVGYKVL